MPTIAKREELLEARHYSNTTEMEKAAVYTDAAEHLDRDAFSVGVVDHEGTPICAATVPVRRPKDVETVAIALAIASTQAKNVLATQKLLSEI